MLRQVAISKPCCFVSRPHSINIVEAYIEVRKEGIKYMFKLYYRDRITRLMRATRGGICFPAQFQFGAFGAKQPQTPRVCVCECV